eukprot:scaffold3654_cov115-Isochrysis_galbana.AAC.2
MTSSLRSASFDAAHMPARFHAACPLYSRPIYSLYLYLLDAHHPNRQHQSTSVDVLSFTATRSSCGPCDRTVDGREPGRPPERCIVGLAPVISLHFAFHLGLRRGRLHCRHVGRGREARTHRHDVLPAAQGLEQVPPLGSGRSHLVRQRHRPGRVGQQHPLQRAVVRLKSPLHDSRGGLAQRLESPDDGALAAALDEGPAAVGCRNVRGELVAVLGEAQLAMSVHHG